MYGKRLIKETLDTKTRQHILYCVVAVLENSASAGRWQIGSALEQQADETSSTPTGTPGSTQPSLAREAVANLF